MVPVFLLSVLLADLRIIPPEAELRQAIKNGLEAVLDIRPGGVMDRGVRLEGAIGAEMPLGAREVEGDTDLHRTLQRRPGDLLAGRSGHCALEPFRRARVIDPGGPFVPKLPGKGPGPGLGFWDAVSAEQDHAL